MMEWQSESSLFTLRVRGKQWYWIYKIDIRGVSDVLSTPKNIGRNKWQFSLFGDLQTANSFHELSVIKTKLIWKQHLQKTMKKITKGGKKSLLNPLMLDSSDANIYRSQIKDITRNEILHYNLKQSKLSFSAADYKDIHEDTLEEALKQRCNSNYYSNNLRQDTHKEISSRRFSSYSLSGYKKKLENKPQSKFDSKPLLITSRSGAFLFEGRKKKLEFTQQFKTVYDRIVKENFKLTTNDKRDILHAGNLKKSSSVVRYNNIAYTKKNASKKIFNDFNLQPTSTAFRTFFKKKGARVITIKDKKNETSLKVFRFKTGLFLANKLAKEPNTSKAAPLRSFFSSKYEKGHFPSDHAKAKNLKFKSKTDIQIKFNSRVFRNFFAFKNYPRPQYFHEFVRPAKSYNHVYQRNQALVKRRSIFNYSDFSTIKATHLDENRADSYQTEIVRFAPYNPFSSEDPLLPLPVDSDVAELAAKDFYKNKINHAKNEITSDYCLRAVKAKYLKKKTERLAWLWQDLFQHNIPNCIIKERLEQDKIYFDTVIKPAFELEKKRAIILDNYYAEQKLKNLNPLVNKSSTEAALLSTWPSMVKFSLPSRMDDVVDILGEYVLLLEMDDENARISQVSWDALDTSNEGKEKCLKDIEKNNKRLRCLHEIIETNGVVTLDDINQEKKIIDTLLELKSDLPMWEAKIKIADIERQKVSKSYEESEVKSKKFFENVKIGECTIEEYLKRCEDDQVGIDVLDDYFIYPRQSKLSDPMGHRQYITQKGIAKEPLAGKYKRLISEMQRIFSTTPANKKKFAKKILTQTASPIEHALLQSSNDTEVFDLLSGKLIDDQTVYSNTHEFIDPEDLRRDRLITQTAAAARLIKNPQITTINTIDDEASNTKNLLTISSKKKINLLKFRFNADNLKAIQRPFPHDWYATIKQRRVTRKISHPATRSIIKAPGSFAHFYGRNFSEKEFPILKKKKRRLVNTSKIKSFTEKDSKKINFFLSRKNLRFRLDSPQETLPRWYPDTKLTKAQNNEKIEEFEKPTYSGNPFFKKSFIVNQNFDNVSLQEEKNHLVLRRQRLITKAKNRTENTKVGIWKRMLRSRRVLVLPTHTNITVITNSFDVVHSWHIPGLGLKMDCLPGRATHHTLYVDNAGMYYGQCAEVCGRFHHHMPIRICALPFQHFLVWWQAFIWPKSQGYLYRHTQDMNPILRKSARRYNW